MNGSINDAESQGVSTLDAALEYLELGLSPVALCSPNHDCDSPGKVPHIIGWQHGSIELPSEEDIRTDFASLRGNVGIVCGMASDIIVVDIDNDESYAWFIMQLGKSRTPRVQTGGGGCHFYFRFNAVIRSQIIFPDGLKLEIQSGRRQVVAPPSFHESGKTYRWLSVFEREKVELFPQWLVDLCVKPDSQPHTEVNTGTIPEGERNRTLFELGCSMRRRGASESSIASALENENSERCIPPLSEEEIVKIAQSAARYKPKAQKEPTSQTQPTALETPKSESPGAASKTETDNTEWITEVKYTDGWRAKELVRLHGADLLYCDDWAQWLVWDGKRFKPDRSLEIVKRAKLTVGSMLREAASIVETGGDANELIKRAKKADSAAQYQSMMNLARSEPEISILPEELDTDPWKLNVDNGVIDLKSGELLPHDKSRLITKLAAVRFDKDAHSELWDAFLIRVMNGNEEMMRFLQRMCGYVLTGDVSEQCFFFLYGSGANGKSVFTKTIQTMMGDYAKTAPRDMLMLKQNFGNAEQKYEVADLKGARLIIASETEKNRTLAESLIKDLTGSERRKGRFPYGREFEYDPEDKILLFGNHQPSIKGTDDGIWRRVKKIDFTVQIPPNEQDKRLTEKLLSRENMQGILAWAVRGCLEWQNKGLGIPPEVVKSTDQYRASMDLLQQFIDDCCVIQKSHQCTKGQAYKAYVKWCDTVKEWPEKKHDFGDLLRERGFIDGRGNRNVAIWLGIGLGDDERELF